MTFHRFVDPSWTNYVPIPPGPGTSQAQPASGGLVYDRVNIASGAIGLGPGEAIVNPPPPAGPTPFTYFVGFSDPGESGNPNRGLAAVTENTDYLDDVVHRDIGVRARVFIPTPLFGPAVNSYTFAPGDFPWLGSGGEDLSELFTITEGVVGGSGYTPNAYFIPGANSSLYVTGTTVAVGSGFVPGAVTLTFNTSTPTPPFSAGIWLHYRTLSSAALIPPDPLGPLPNGIDGTVARFLYRLDGTPEAYGHASWGSGDRISNTPFHSLWKLNHYGLNQMLLRDTDPLIDTVPSKIAYMTPNVANATAGTQPGFWGLRGNLSRHSPMMVSQQSQTAADFAFLDPVNALWTAWMEDVGNAHRGGSTGFMVYGQRRMTLSAFDAGSGATQQGAGYASFLHVSNHPQGGGAPAGTHTYIPQDTPAVVGNVAGEARIDISPGAWFWQNVAGDYRSAIALGYDLLELQFSAGAPPQTFVIVDFFSDTVAVIQNLDGTVPSFVFGTPCTVRWRSMVYGVSDGVAGYDVTTTSRLKFDGLFYAAPHKVDPAGVPQNAARGDYSAKLYAMSERADVNALGWGGFRANSADVTKIGLYYDNGLLRGDGGIEAKKFIARLPQVSSVLAATVTLDFAAAAAEADYYEFATVDVSSSPITNITAPALNAIANDIGRVFRWIIRHDTCALQISSLSAWPGTFVFENLSDAWFSNAVGYVDVYTGVASHSASGALKIFMSVQRYNSPLGQHMAPTHTGYNSRYQWIPETGAAIAPKGVHGSGDPPNPRGYVGNQVRIQVRLELEVTIAANTTCDFSAIYPTEFFNPGPTDYWVRILQFSRPANKLSTDKTFLVIDGIEILTGEALGLVNPQSAGSSFFMEIRRNGVTPLNASGDAIWSTTGVALPTGQLPLITIPGTMEPTAVPLAIGGDLRASELAIKIRNEDIANDITGFAGSPPVLLINILGHEVITFSALP